MFDFSVIKEFRATLAEKFQLAEKVEVNLNLFPRNQILAIEAPEPPDPLTEGAETVPLELPAASERDRLAVRMSLPRRIAVIKAWDFKGLRVHWEFAIVNDSERVVAVEDLVVAVGDGPTPDGLFFKQFVDVQVEARLPSSTRLPVLIEPHSGIRLCAEFEGAIDPGIGKAELGCTLHAMAEGDVLKSRVMVHGNPFLEAVLEQVQEAATEAKGAGALQVPVSPAPADESPDA